jgi:outer membrane protein TolC
MKGVPLRVELGPKDIEAGHCGAVRRDTGEKVFVPLENVEDSVKQLLQDVHDNLYAMAEKNLEKADENLRYATLGFEEGVIPASNVLEAHTAWLSAQSEKIDAQIDVKLTEIYLKKATGSLNIEN